MFALITVILCELTVTVGYINCTASFQPQMAAFS